MAAVASVVRGAPPDVVVVVSDNSTDAAECERLSEFCSGQPDNVVYVRPPEPLAMSSHWEWLQQVIRDRVAPTHIAYLTDRMVFTDGSLHELLAVVEREPDSVLSCREDRVIDLTTPVQLVQSQWTGCLFELDAGRLIELSSRAMWGDYLPRMLNCIVPVGVVDAIERRFGSVFRSIAPDYAFAYRCLAVCDRILFLDRACLIHYGMTSSAGISYLRGEPNEHANDFERNLSEQRFGATPEPAFETVANAILDEYCRVQAAAPDRFPPLRWQPYLRANAVSASRIENPEWRARVQELLRRRGWTRRRNAQYVMNLTASMAGYFLRHPGAFARSVRRQLIDRPPGTPAARILPRLGLDPRLRDELMFHSAAEAIAHAEAHPRERTRYAWHVHQLTRARAIRRTWPPPDPPRAA
ncbi:MAG TPA: hypothetical protein VGW10_01080 [Solirubrobacteraceae bacterium]|nr:hypothetical protein [Solirubrobacteraceae bacterium]